MTLIGLDAGEEAQTVFSAGNGNVVGKVTIIADELTADGVLECINTFDANQFNVIAGGGDEFYVGDIFFL